MATEILAAMATAAEPEILVTMTMENQPARRLPLPIIDRFENKKDAGGPASFMLYFKIIHSYATVRPGQLAPLPYPLSSELR